MARFNGAQWRPIPVNFTKGGQEAVQGVVIHIMDGSLSGTESWFRNSEAQASSHFGTGKAGALYQWVDTGDRAWAQAGGNRRWLSIENEGRGGDSLTDAQINRCAEVLAWAARTYGVPLQVTNDPTGRGLGWHGMGGSAWGGHTSCPGSNVRAQLPEIVRRAQQINGGGSSGGSAGGTYTVKSGDTLSEIGQRLGINWQSIASANGIPAPYVIQVGQKLTLPGARTYTVKSGDTLSEIGQRLGINWQSIASANGISAPYVINIGQVLRLP
ncbi:LysM peptidoglycan-binding domain-containing protein [Kitasatospora sp. YST-16]|uniref:LysM peptidoglycan-binding domain-containing protein n=1 Tax=Kitasatospora sp. YST-16 TaxID=2998080 RepID=UPI002284A77F|nr:LysM peptidoglycan-binding domain-containing protein [Kitasatospora sp. YST-16]WAL73119.1 LysM peptidoglycan-binding domain-containing protein [Kitasatospora sp. YST-16]WNW39173.1 LysM peptidoglycan-binding domain-containing protein [Streptomyces sp. Li-HN-5-13]